MDIPPSGAGLLLCIGSDSGSSTFSILSSSAAYGSGALIGIAATRALKARDADRCSTRPSTPIVLGIISCMLLTAPSFVTGKQRGCFGPPNEAPASDMPQRH